jgi:hypothetical protein
MKKSERVAEWCDDMLTALRSANVDFDFLSRDTLSRVQSRKAGVHSFDLIRRRTDNLYDRLFLEFEYFDPPNKAELEPLGFTQFGWFLRVQYAINKHSHCAIPCIVEGFYCNLFDLTEYASEYESLLADDGDSYHLSKDEAQFDIKFIDLAALMAATLPSFCRRAITEKIKPQQVEAPDAE